jgi:hypothetical protein
MQTTDQVLAAHLATLLDTMAQSAGGEGNSMHQNWNLKCYMSTSMSIAHPEDMPYHDQPIPRSLSWLAVPLWLRLFLNPSDACLVQQ